MKKILIALVLFVFAALPMSVMAMTSISDNDLSTVTGQAGVSIGADVTMNVSFGTVAWGDSDGFSGATDAGWVGLSNGYISNMRIHMRGDMGMTDTSVMIGYIATGGLLHSEYLSELTAGDTSLVMEKAGLLSVLATNQLLTIDVGTAGGKTYVRIGVPTFEIDMDSMTASVGLWSGTNAPNQNSFQKLGDIGVYNMVALLGKNSHIDISQNDTKSGIELDITGPSMVDTLTIGALSWGDTDGNGTTRASGNPAVNDATNHKGYVGLTNLDVESIGVNAKVNINVSTATGWYVNTIIAMDYNTFNGWYLYTAKPGLYNDDPTIKDTIGYLLNQHGTIGLTAVDIQLSGNMSIGSMYANVALGSDSPLTTGTNGNKNLLGQIYVAGVDVTIPVGGSVLGHTSAISSQSVAPNSWVTISAH